MIITMMKKDNKNANDSDKNHKIINGDENDGKDSKMIIPIMTITTRIPMIRSVMKLITVIMPSSQLADRTRSLRGRTPYFSYNSLHNQLNRHALNLYTLFWSLYIYSL